MTVPQPPVLIVPGLGNSGPEHWQSQLREAEAHLAQLTESYHF